MLIYEYGQQNKYEQPCVFLLGGFDGLHVGHKTLLDFAKTYRLPVGMMTITGGKGDGLFTLPEREKIFAANGVDFLLSVPFTEEFKNTSKEDFLRQLLARINVAAFVCGKDFRFGAGAAGTPEFIREYTDRPVHALELLNIGGEKVAVHAVKKMLQEGNIEQANQLLLQPFFVGGKVETGRRVGRKLGFPTANITYPAHKFPLKEGVYAAHAVLNGKEYGGIANFGACPTFEVIDRKIEVYFDGFEGDLYGKNIDVFFDWYIRDIVKFQSAEELTAELTRNLQSVREKRRK
ncbi:MAG: riboflavin biosynthesis protein RibF [Clostridia bacterium]|nr:riboflavin biosynthesis protein RibF [Clostridia bacterium]